MTVAPAAGGVIPGDGLAADGDGLAAEGEGLAADGDGLAADGDGDGEAPVGAVGVVPVVPPPQATRMALPAATAENFRNLLLLSFSLVVTIYYLPLEVIFQSLEIRKTNGVISENLYSSCRITSLLSQGIQCSEYYYL